MTGIVGELVWYSPRLWPLAAVVAAVVSVVVVMLYLPQARMLAQPWRWLLPTLRVMGLLALVGSILKPVAVRQATPAEAGAIVILVDRSKSMSIHDLAHVPAEINKENRIAAARYLVGLADGLGMLRAGARDSAMVQLRSEEEKLRAAYGDFLLARSELEFTRVSGQGAQAGKARVAQAVDRLKGADLQLVNQSNSIGKNEYLRKTVARLDEVVREAPERWGARINDGLGEVDAAIAVAQGVSDLALYQANADVRAVCDQIAGMSRFDRAEMALTNPGSGLLARLPGDAPLFGFSIAETTEPLPLRGAGQPVRRLLVEPDGAASDLTGGVSAAMSRLQGQPIQAVVILSDGQQVGGDPSVPWTVTASGIPIFSIDVADLPRELPLHDISLSRLTVPESCFVGETVTARTELRSSGYKGNAVVTQVGLSTDDAAPTTRPAALSEGAGWQEFPLKFDKPGIHKIVASIPAPADAPTTENKHLERWIKVLSDKVHVGLYAGSAGWDFQYVRDAMSRTPWIDLHDAILATDDAKFPLTPEEILKLDVLLLFDVQAGSLSDGQWDAVYKLVTERSASVILVAGDEYFPGQYGEHQLPSSFLPYLPGQKPVWRAWPGKEAGFHLIPAPGARALDALKLDDETSEAAAQQWAELPAFYRYLSLPELKPNARALLIDRDSSSPVLLESRLGLGHVFFFGATETWRWRYKVGQKLQDRFWLQLVRYAADQPYAVRNKTLALDESRVSAEPGASILIRARVTQGDGSPSGAAQQVAQLLRGGAVERTIVLTPVGGMGSGRYQAKLGDVAEGDYQIRLEGADAEDSISLPLHIAKNFEAEMADLEGSEQPMRHMSESSGGAMVTLDQLATLPDLISHARTSASRLTERPLWDSYYLYFFVLACFAAEWAIRKRVGLL